MQRGPSRETLTLESNLANLFRGIPSKRSPALFGNRGPFDGMDMGHGPVMARGPNRQIGLLRVLDGACDIAWDYFSDPLLAQVILNW